MAGHPELGRAPGLRVLLMGIPGALAVRADGGQVPEQHVPEKGPPAGGRDLRRFRPGRLSTSTRPANVVSTTRQWPLYSVKALGVLYPCRSGADPSGAWCRRPSEGHRCIVGGE